MELVKNFEFLKKNGFNVAEFGFARTISEAIQIANKIGYPVVLKIPLQIHKRDIGGVVTHIHNVTDLKELSKKMVLELAKKGIKFDGLIVQKQIKGIETIVGIKKDKIFGKVILFGSGGKFVEIIKDVVFRVCPIDEKDAEEMIKETKIGKLIKNKEILKKILPKFCKLNVNEMDINPLIVNNDGYWIVDARII